MLEKEQKFEYCPACGGMITDQDYFYRRRSPIMGYRCSQCGFFQFFNWKDEN